MQVGGAPSGDSADAPGARLDDQSRHPPQSGPDPSARPGDSGKAGAPGIIRPKSVSENLSLPRAGSLRAMIKARGGGAAGKSSTMGNVAIDPESHGAHTVPAANGHLLRRSSSMMPHHCLRRAASPPPARPRNTTCPDSRTRR